jgi:HAD superfamily hydrolase (TIGR01490 family)
MRSRDWLKQEFVRAVLGGCSRPEIDRWTQEFARRYGKQLLKPAAAETVRRHRSLGHRLIIATASVDAYAATLAEMWGIAETVSTRLEWQAGRLTGRLDGPNLRGEAKVAAVRHILGVEKNGRPEIFAYSDDHSDLPLLKFATHGFAVDPTRKLTACAEHENLKVLNWKRSGAVSAAGTGPIVSQNAVRGSSPLPGRRSRHAA